MNVFLYEYGFKIQIYVVLFFSVSCKKHTKTSNFYDTAPILSLVTIYGGSLISILLFIYDATSRRYTYWILCEQVDSFWHRGLFGIFEYLEMISLWISLIPNLIVILYYWHETYLDLNTLR